MQQKRRRNCRTLCKKLCTYGTGALWVCNANSQDIAHTKIQARTRPARQPHNVIGSHCKSKLKA
eukprot:83860-Amphidinium_carterae.1